MSIHNPLCAVLVLISFYRASAVIPKSVTPSRIESNFKVISLTDDQVAEINKIGEEKPARFNLPILYSPLWPGSLLSITF